MTTLIIPRLLESSLMSVSFVWWLSGVKEVFWWKASRSVMKWCSEGAEEAVEQAFSLNLGFINF